jgi:TolA-binding protein
MRNTFAVLRFGALGWAILFPVLTQAGDSAELERKTIDEDRSALESFKASAISLYHIMEQKRKAPNAYLFIEQYAENLNNIAAIQFRLVHSDSKNSSDKLKEYQSTLEKLIETETLLITMSSRPDDHGRSYLLRGKAYKELERDDEASRDLKFVLDHRGERDPGLQSRVDQTEGATFLNAGFTLNEILTKNKDYQTAIIYLNKMERSAGSQYKSLILDQLAFSHYSINEIPAALSYLEKELYLPDPQIDRAKVFRNYTLYYFTGLSQANPNYTIQGFLPTLLRLKPQKELGGILKYFINLLRSKGMDDFLEAFKNSTLKSQLRPAELSEFLSAVIEAETSKKAYTSLIETLGSFKLINWTDIPQESKGKLFSTLTSSTAQLQASYLKIPETQNRRLIEDCLISAYLLLIRVGKPSDVDQFRFNLGEIYFQRKDFDAATGQYSLIARTSNPTPSSPLAEKAYEKMLLSKYESLSAKQAFPKTLHPVKRGSFTAKPDAINPGGLTPGFKNWLEQVDHSFQLKPSETLGAYLFEAARALYSQGSFDPAFHYLDQMINKTPDAKYAPAAVSLILDTWIMEENWAVAQNTALKYLKIIPAKNQDFRAQLSKTAADCLFKQAESEYFQGHYIQALERVDVFLKTYPTDPKVLEASALGGNAALGLKDKKKASIYFARVLKSGPSPQSKFQQNMATALLTQASLAEDDFDIDSEIPLYLQYLQLPSVQKELNSPSNTEIRKKIIYLSWYSGQTGRFVQTLANPQICGPTSNDLCEPFRAIAAIESLSSPSPSALNRWRQLKKTPRSSLSSQPLRQSLWATAALEHSEQVPYDERNQLILFSLSEWENQDSNFRYFLIPHLSESLIRAFRISCLEIQKKYPFSLNQKKMSRRTQEIEKLENLAQKLVALPWARVQALTYHEWANLTSGFVREIKSFPIPKEVQGDDLKVFQSTLDEMTRPLIQKATEFRTRAISIAQTSGIEAKAFQEILRGAQEERLELVKMPLPASSPASILFTEELLKSTGMPLAWQKSFTSSLNQKNLPKIGYLVQLAQATKTLKPEIENTLLGLSLLLAGAQAEGVKLLETSAPKLSQPLQGQVYSQILQIFRQLGNTEKSKAHPTQKEGVHS